MLPTRYIARTWHIGLPLAVVVVSLVFRDLIVATVIAIVYLAVLLVTWAIGGPRRRLPPGS